MAAMQVLAKYNIMGLGLGIGVATMAQMRQGEQPIQQQPPPMMQPPQRYDMGPGQMMGGPVMGSLMDPGERNDSVNSYDYSEYSRLHARSAANFTRPF